MARNKDSQELAEEKPAPAGKGHATPRRREREAARRRPLVIDTKEDAKRRRAERAARAERERQALVSGDERNMPAQHAGPARRFARDFIDSRTTVGEFLLPASVIAMIVLVFFGQLAELVAAVGLALLLMILAWIVESWFLLRKMRRQAVAKFGEGKIPRAFGFYGLTRLMQFRRLRLPKPQVKRGAYPA